MICIKYMAYLPHKKLIVAFFATNNQIIRCMIIFLNEENGSVIYFWRLNCRRFANN